MAAKRRTSRDRLHTETLLKSLEAQISKLNQIKVDDKRAASILEDAIAELKRDARILKVIASHIFIFIPKK